MTLAVDSAGHRGRWGLVIWQVGGFSRHEVASQPGRGALVQAECLGQLRIFFQATSRPGVVLE